MEACVEPAPHVLREYALIADGERGALIDPHGDIAWLCAPRWDSPAVLSTLLGGRGRYSVAPLQRFVWGGYYEDGSLIWRSRWITDDDAVVECREALAFPGDPHRAVILRQLSAVRGEAHVAALLAPAADFGHASFSGVRRSGDGVWTGRSGALRVRWSGAPRAVFDGESGALRAQLRLSPGERHDLVLELSDREFDRPPPHPGSAWGATETGWRETLPDLGRTVADRDARHAYAVMRGLTTGAGGMVAAATTSLPERADQGRDYDYRYVWVRDQCFAGQAVAAAGPHPLLDTAVDFVAQRVLTDGPDLMPAYTAAGTAVPPQRELDLPGYPGGSNVIGNHVRDQFQLDVFGEALLLFAAAARHDRLDAERFRAIGVAVAAVEKRWQDAGAGLWELDAQRWTHSRLVCAAGLRQVAAAAVPASEAAAWNTLADRIVASTAADSLHPSGRWQRTPQDPRVDAALLIPALRGALPADDPCSVATLSAIRDELGRDGYVYRFRHDRRPLDQAEGAFLLCGFLTAMAAHQQGDVPGAMRLFERNRAACGPPGLYSEEYDVVQRQMRGNLPQAFVHAALLEAAARLAD
ncbi:glycoside hydrolase 15-related protein [Pseudonocardia dioxanivorans CB1190]|uniref:Glycoside hydrolase 15-related protein n=1 Tax=Pseudonocardia dioxanivorans (strain ATCC 55486 / DSM 44775 / JCM 13855 / CB1190) TaxID=675635 RepID=F4CK38_PSEUX|nr:glycoside hydrolase family 15 protein [Pseudonocardia dioxanivorans]AEA28144.1 glycoside hydrolase 15-related protein [Pseudonocardia dioxanivorans CB1190]